MTQETHTFTDGFTLVKNGDITVSREEEHSFDGNGEMTKIKPVLKIVGTDFEHTFSSASRVSKALLDTPLKDIASRFEGGHFFSKDGNLVDWKDSDYANRGNFVQEPEGIQQLINRIGFEAVDRRTVRHNNTASQSIALRKEWSDHAIYIPEYRDGGDMSSRLSFVWNPFAAHVGTAYELVRLICANGMVGLSSFFSAKIPMVNDWEEGLAIANKRIQSEVTSLIARRMAEMGKLPATVRDCHRIVNMCQDRLESDLNREDDKTRQILARIQMAADPMLHLTDHYDGALLTDMQLGDQLPSHLSLFTLWNMLTEANSHTYEGGNSSQNGVTKFANEVLIDRGIASSNTTAAAGRLIIESSSFDNTEAALGNRIASGF